MNKPTLSQLLTGVTLPTALVVEVFFATAAVQATPVARADSPQALVRIFFDALQSTDAKIVNPEFRRRYFTNSFNQYDFQEKIVGAFANTTLTFGEPITIDSSNVIVKVNVSELRKFMNSGTSTGQLDLYVPALTRDSCTTPFPCLRELR